MEERKAHEACRSPLSAYASNASAPSMTALLQWSRGLTEREELKGNAVSLEVCSRVCELLPLALITDPSLDTPALRPGL